MATPCSVSPISATGSRAVSRFLETTLIRLPFGMGIERDIFFATDLPISVWAEAARRAGCLGDAERVLYHAAQSGREGAYDLTLEIRNATDAQSRFCGAVPSGSSACGAVLRVRGLPVFFDGFGDRESLGRPSRR